MNTPKQKYVRPAITYTDTLQSHAKIKKSLENYTRIDNIDSIPLGTFIKYVTYTKGKPRLCIGGRLYKKNNDYVMIKGRNHIIFSVQKYHWKEDANKEEDDPIFITMFFKSKIDKQIILINQLNNTILSLKKENEKKTKENQLLKTQLYQIYKDHPDMFA